jgi:hypothetical protein
MGCLDKILFVIDLPFDILRKITLPPCDENKYSKVLAVLFPGPGILLVLVSTFREP